ncbi:flagellin N-terminal helical domain-containing protein [Ponticaulis profundi]|uniref:Flagellin n=1 Tax=Ponticaulis profundi TaxID=2665222 RepID=A0ABW1S5A4_9PROT
MVSSIHTNSAAMSALQTLAGTNSELETAQNRVSSGYKVAGSRDNSAVYAVAQNMRGDVAALTSVSASLDRANSITDVAIAAGEAISDLLIEMREKAVSAKDPSIDSIAREAYNNDFKALIDQIGKIIRTAEFDGANLLDNSLTNGIAFLADAQAVETLSVSSEDFSFSGAILTFGTTDSLGTVALASAAVTAVNASLNNVNAALSRLGSSANQIDAHLNFVSKLTDSLDAGIGFLVDADLSKESARLQALQVKQQLGVQALSIANQNPQTILSLFQG